MTSLERGGPLEHAHLLARELVAGGATVRAVVAGTEQAQRFAAVGADPVIAPLRRPGDGAGARAVVRACRGADVVHSHDRRSGLWTRLLPPPRRGVLVHTMHGLPEAYLPPPAGPARPGLRAVLAYRGLERALAARADALVVPSRAAAALVARRLGYPPGAIRVVPNGVDARPVAGDGVLVGTLGALEPVKGLEVFVRAASGVATAYPEQRFAVHGAGSEAPRLRMLASRLGLGERLEFAGHVPADWALGRLRVLVCSSHLEFAPLALLEAMAAGVPAVATDVGGVREVTAGTVPLVAPGDPAALAATIAATLEDPVGAAERAARARAAAADATPRRTADLTLGVYREALGRADRARRVRVRAAPRRRAPWA